MNPELLTASQVARRLGLSAERIRQLARAGRLQPAQRSPLGQLWAADAVEAFAATRDPWGRYQPDTSATPAGAARDQQVPSQLEEL
jgi:hypothetical protein